MKYAFATIHFGSNPVYLELELYFFKMLRHYTNYDILYLYSKDDTPETFVKAVAPLVSHTIPYDDKGITYDVNFVSQYTNFNTLRTCNFIFAYMLTNYDKICIIESDMVIMKNMGSIFSLRSPAALTYYIGNRNLKFNRPINNTKASVLRKCKEGGRLNGGVMLIEPSVRLFHQYVNAIKDVIANICKYPNETLFEYVNNHYFNLPVQYNLSHYHTKRLDSYGLTPEDIYVYHFNETKFKHLDIITNPVDEHGDNWLEKMHTIPKYSIKKLPILHYKTFYDQYHPEIMRIMQKVRNPNQNKSKSKSPSKTMKRNRCPKGYHRNKITGNCDAVSPEKKKEKKKYSRCAKGHRRNKITGKCDKSNKIETK